MGHFKIFFYLFVCSSAVYECTLFQCNLEFLGHTHGTRRDVQNPQASAVTWHCALDMKNKCAV